MKELETDQHTTCTKIFGVCMLCAAFEFAAEHGKETRHDSVFFEHLIVCISSVLVHISSLPIFRFILCHLHCSSSLSFVHLSFILAFYLGLFSSLPLYTYVRFTFSPYCPQVQIRMPRCTSIVIICALFPIH